MSYEVLLTVPSVTYGALKQTHIRQDHANQQFRIDGIPIPDTVSGSFADIVPPRAWERADIILGGMEAQYGNKTRVTRGYHEQERHETGIRLHASLWRIQ